MLVPERGVDVIPQEAIRTFFAREEEEYASQGCDEGYSGSEAYADAEFGFVGG